MTSRIKPRVVGGMGAFVGSVWTAYSYFTTAMQLPKDAGKLAQMLADPPIYIPWLILVGSALVLGWSLWPRKDEPHHIEPATNQETYGANSLS